MRRRTAVIVGAIATAVLLVSACGSSTRPVANTSPARSPRSLPANNLIVLTVSELNGATTLRLIGPDGRVAASTRFDAPPRPNYSNCAPLLQPPVRVAGGAAFFVDKAGVVRKLSPDGSVTPIATFKLSNPQQAVSYAVSPDGSKLIAIVLSTPPLHNPPPQQLGDPVYGPGTWSIDLETAVAGGATTMVLHRDLGSAFPTPTIITGWDYAGPTATHNSAICTQNTIPSLHYNGTLVRLGMDGSHLERIGGADCNAWDELGDGTVLCGGQDWQSFTVRSRNGSILWSGGGGQMFNTTLSPDGSAVASAFGFVFLRDSTQRASFARTDGPQWSISGWAGPGTVVVRRPDGHLGVAPATGLTSFSDLGLQAVAESQEVTAAGSIAATK